MRPIQRVADGSIQRITAAGSAGSGRLAETKRRIACPAKIEVKACLIGDRPAEIRSAGRRVESRWASRKTGARFVDDRRCQGRTQRDGASIAIRRLTALVRETGELRLYVIEKVRAAPAVQVAPSSLQMMLVGQIEVESLLRASVDAEARWIVAVSLQVRIGQLRDAAGCSGGAANVGQQFPDHRINRRSLTVCGRQSEQVDLPDLARHVVLENA